MEKVFEDELRTIKTDNVREFCECMLEAAPEYFYTVPASATGKYHPKFALGNGGLVRHTKAVVRILNDILELEMYRSVFSEREMDLLRVAAILHDSKKYGDKGSKYPVFDHPLIASEWVLDAEVDADISRDDRKFIADAIASHMGQFNTSKFCPGVILPKPVTEAEKIVHLCDYIASRRDIFDAE